MFRRLLELVVNDDPLDLVTLLPVVGVRDLVVREHHVVLRRDLRLEAVRSSDDVVLG